MPDNIIPMQRKQKTCAEKLSFWFNAKFAEKPEPKKRPMATRNRPRDTDPTPPSAA